MFQHGSPGEGGGVPAAGDCRPRAGRHQLGGAHDGHEGGAARPQRGQAGGRHQPGHHH